jgi:hypothetical protein
MNRRDSAFTSQMYDKILRKEEERSVAYVKPEVALVAPATQAIQGGLNKNGVYLEGNGRDFDGSMSAYEADE